MEEDYVFIQHGPIRASHKESLKETENITERLKGSEGREAFSERLRQAHLAHWSSVMPAI